MLKLFLLGDKRGDISWLLNQIGLLLATGILLGAITSSLFFDEWQRKAEIENITIHFTTAIESASLKEFPEKIVYKFPDKSYGYEVKISTEYITVKIPDEEIIVKKRFPFRVWANPPVADGYGINGICNYLSNIYGEGNNGSSPESKISKENIEKEFNSTAVHLSLNPLSIETKKSVYIEKIFLYTEEGREEYVIIYQR
ncbi:MAG TPA: hypothetical protein ENI33_07290 [Thermoplasmatales archaeon]|nr:hypothetical protein [Thermoplasmatales archaeon]